MYRLISGLIRKTGYSRGADGKVLYNIMGSSMGIRMNERLTYTVREATKLAQDGITIDVNDATMKADTLLQSIVNISNESAVYTASSIAANSDVENFIPSLTIEYGELQDAINAIEEQTNADFLIDVNNVAQLRYELKGLTNGRGFTIKNKKGAVDDVDDTMYLLGKAWDYEESCYKSDGYSSGVVGILPAETLPSTREDMGFIAAGFSSEATPTQEQAQKFRPSHGRFFPGDIYIVGGETADSGSTLPWATRFRIVGPDTANTPNSLPVRVNIDFLHQQFDSPILQRVGGIIPKETYHILNEQIFYNSSNVRIDSVVLDTTKDYWIIASNDNILAAHFFTWGQNPSASSVRAINISGGLSTNSSGGTGWSVFAAGTGKFCFDIPRRRSISFEAKEPKAINNLGSGLTTGGTIIESSLSNSSSIITTKEGLAKYLINQLYYMARPRTNFSMASVTAPNIPVYPGDSIVISDSVLGFSVTGSQAVIGRCGDMTYQWGNMGSGGYQAPTILNIQPVVTPTRYK